MESFVFNSFKERFVSGDIALEDTWHHYPVNRGFTASYGDDMKYFRSSADFIMYDMAHNPSTSSYFRQIVYEANPTELFNDWYGYYGTRVIKTDYYYTPMTEVDSPMKPEFVTLAAWESFSNKEHNAYLKELFFNPSSIFYRESGMTDIEGNQIPRGFYYVTTKEELLWCANKVNGSVYDNTINIVLGDNIGGFISKNPEDSENPEKYSKINFSIGSNPAHPYEGIFFGNGYGFEYVELVCQDNVGGIVGYLGKNGIVNHIWVKDCWITCQKDISLTHLMNDGTDVAVGFICGKNDGYISHISIKGDIAFKNFIPKMYSVANKSDINTDAQALGSPDSNIFYPDYLCYNSLGNIVPYIGYFNEGVFATYSGYSKADEKVYQYWNTDTCPNGFISKQVPGGIKSPAEWYYWSGLEYSGIGYMIPYTAPANKKNILWYDSTIIETTYKMVNPAAQALSVSYDNGLLPIDPFTPYGQQTSAIEFAAYFDKSIKMNQQNRAAYYVSPCIGINAGNVDSLYVDTNMVFSGTFVGFAGAVAGKQSEGTVTNSTISVSALEYVDKEGKVIRNKLLSYDTEATTDYNFDKKSIKNIGGLFGSLVVGDAQSLNINNVNTSFVNMANACKDTDGKPYDFSFANRFGGIAAVMEYNSCNISDIWIWNDKIPDTYKIINDAYNNVNDNTGTMRSIKFKDCKVSYSERPNIKINSENLLQFQASEHGYVEHYVYGVSSPIVAEIKPTYLSVPSIISTPFHNTSAIKYSETNTMLSVLNTTKIKHSWERIGLFTMDQQLAGPWSDVNFWSINTEVDLPGISNSQEYVGITTTGWKYSGYAGGVIDRLNYPAGVNFDINIKTIAGKVIKWDNTQIFSDSYVSNFFQTVTIPEAAEIPSAQYEQVNESLEPVHEPEKTYHKEYPTGISGTITSARNGIVGLELEPVSETATETPAYRAVISAVTTSAPRRYDWSFNSNKLAIQYPYFGSDIIIDRNIVPVDNDGNYIFTYRDSIDLTSPALEYDHVDIIFDNIPYYGDDINDGSSKLAKCSVGTILFRIQKDAFKYAPFTNIDYMGSTPDAISALYKVFVNDPNADGGSNKIGADWTMPWYWKNTPAVQSHAYSNLSDFYMSNQGIDDWLLENANDASMGWYYWVSEHEDEYKYFVNAFISFDPKPFSLTNINGNFPPNYPFTIGYLCGRSDYSARDAGYADKRKVFNNPGHDHQYRAGVRSLKQKPLTSIQSITFYNSNDAEIDITTALNATNNNIRVPYTDQKITGKFHNGLLRSYQPMMDPAEYTESMGSQIFTADSAAWCNDLSMYTAFKDNYDTAVTQANDESVPTYFKYTYTRKDDNTGDFISGSTWDCKFDYSNGKAGFWISNSAAEYSAGMYNDSIRYSENYATFGTTINERCILGKLMYQPNQMLSAESFSADDFEGLYVTDGQDRPVMYIDIGLGRCERGTTWSYRCTPNIPESAFGKEDEHGEVPAISGLLLEVNTDV